MAVKLTSFKLNFFSILLSSMLMVCAYNTYAQSRILIDSLQKLNAVVNDTTKVFNYNRLAKAYLISSNYDSANYYLRLSSDLSQKMKFTRGLARVYDLYGHLLNRYGDYTKALEYKYKALKIFESEKDYKGAASVYNNIGIIYFRDKDYTKALSKYFQALELAKRINDNELISNFKLNIGEVYMILGRYKEALQYEMESLELSEGKYLENSGYAKGIIGLIYLKTHDYDNSRKNIREALIHFTKLEDKYARAEYLIYLAQAYRALKDNYIALSYLNESVRLATEINAKEWKKEAYKEIAELYKSQHDYETALTYIGLYNACRDSIYNENSTKKTAQMNALYENERKETQISMLQQEKLNQDKELQRQQLLAYIFITGTVIISGLAISLKVIDKKRQKAYKELQEKNEEISRQQEEIIEQSNELKKFNVLIEKEKNKADQLLRNILPFSVAEELKEKGEAKPKFYDQVTILFADFVNFTNYAEHTPPQEITRKLDSFFLTFDMICERNNLEKIKTIGDCYMAAGGLPIVNETNAIDAVKTGIEIIQAVKESGWEIRIGVHTGPVVAGVIGINKFAYDVWGDSVNIASRLEATSENNKINISKETYERVKAHFTCIYRGKIPVKNKGDIDMYFVEG